MLGNNQVHPANNTTTAMSPPSYQQHQQPLLASTSSPSQTIEGNLFRGKTLDFFLQLSILLKEFLVDVPRSLQEVKGYLILLSDSVHINLKIATLLDGTSIDFLFGSKLAQANTIFTNVQKAKVYEIKQFIRELDLFHQEYIAEFYHMVYQELLQYLTEQEDWCSCLLQASYEEKLTTHIQQHFQRLLQQIRRT